MASDNSGTPGRVARSASILLCLFVLAACGKSGKDSLAPGEEKHAADEAEITDRMIDAIKDITMQRYPKGNRKRFNQSKGLGCFDATFTVATDIPANLRHGIFAGKRAFPAKIRFANATQSDDREKDFHGMSIKLFDVDGEVLWGRAGEQDLLLNSYPALFAANPKDFLAFIEAQRDDNLFRYFIRPGHFYSLKILFKGRQKIDSPFAIRYWSTTPYRLGPDPRQAVKYSVKPCDGQSFTATTEPGPDFLTDVMAQQLAAAPACFDFLVQVQTDPETMPIENAAVIWDEQQSPFVELAKITIDNQPFTSPENVRACEEMSFNPWQSLADHRPVGGINRVRKPIYAEMAAFRRAE